MAGNQWQPWDIAQNNANSGFQPIQVPVQNTTGYGVGQAGPDVMKRIATANQPKVDPKPGGAGTNWFGDAGVLGSVASIGGAGVNAYLGMKGLDLAEDQFDFQKDSWERNFAMMQDQYYRKLNQKRANRQYYSMGYGERQGTGEAIGDHFDSGADMAGSKWGQAPAAPVNGPTVANAQMSAQGSPFNLQTKQAAAGAPGITMPGAINSQFVNDIKPDNATVLGGLGINNTPTTAAGAALSNTQVGPQGVVKKRVKKRNPQNSNDNANDSEVVE